MTNDPALENSPDWSPDGARIAFLKYDGGPANPNIYLMNASDGGTVTRLTNGVAVRGGPSWSPDGSRIAFTCADDAGTADVCAINADGSGFAHLTSGAQYDVTPGFSPDGSQMVTLVVGDWTGQTSSVTQAVSVVAASNPTSSFTATCIGRACSFDSNASSDDRGIVWRVWTFGDGGSAVNVITPSDTYTADGTYTVTVAITDGDGQTTSSSHTVSAVASNPPTASFTLACSGRTCAFDSKGSSDDYGIVSRTWTFGDGSSAANVVAPSHSYAVDSRRFQGIYSPEPTGRGSASALTSVTQQRPVCRHLTMTRHPIHLCGRTVDRPGHICAFFTSRDQEYDTLIPYFAEGVEEGENVLNVVDDERLSDHRARVERAGLPLQDEHFSIATSEDTYLRGGHFDMSRMVSFVRENLERAAAAGRCVRTAGWMDWVHRDAPGTDRVIEYEARMNLLVPTFDCTFVCVYDLARLRGEMVVDIMATHPYVILKGELRENSFFIPPEVYLRELLTARQPA